MDTFKVFIRGKPIRLVHLIGRKSLHYEKTRMFCLLSMEFEMLRNLISETVVQLVMNDMVCTLVRAR